MGDKRKLIIVKTIHTLIWIFFNLVLLYMAYAVLKNKIDQWLWLGMVFMAAETAVLLVYDW